MSFQLDAQQTRQSDFERLEHLHFECPTRPDGSSRPQVVSSEPKSSSPRLGAEHPSIACLDEQMKAEQPEAESGPPETHAEPPELQVACLGATSLSNVTKPKYETLSITL